MTKANGFAHSSTLRSILSLSLIASAGAGCSKTTATTPTTAATATYSVDKPSAVITTVGKAVAVAGAGISGTATSSLARSSRDGLEGSANMTSANCGSHGQPLDANGTQINSSDTKFPGTTAYCIMTKNDYSPETVQGAFETPRAVICAAERAGITFDGLPHSVTLTLDTNCMTSTQLAQMTGGSATSVSMTATITASKPAAFNTYFDSGIRVQISSENIDYSVGTKITSSSIEFLSAETGGTNESGAFSGSLDLNTGALRYEGRMERILCTTASRCGWNRHIRAYADLKITNGAPSDVKGISLAYMNIAAPPGQSGYQGVLVTADGTLASGIKARAWNANNGTAGQSPTASSQYDTIANWAETTNTYCYTNASDTATTCGTGVPLFTSNTHFLLNNATHTAPATYLTGFKGMTFTAVNLNNDTE